MSNLRLNLLAASLLALFVAGTGNARQVESQPTRLALEVAYVHGVPPTYLAVAETQGRGGAWYGRFRRIESFQPPPGTLPVRAVDIRPSVEGDKVKIVVSVHVGRRFHEKQEPVATYLASENGKLVVGELRRFGVEPFELTVVRLAPIYAAPPAVVNDTVSIEAVSVEPRDATLPRYDLLLRNSSSKAVLALELNTIMRISS